MNKALLSIIFCCSLFPLKAQVLFQKAYGDVYAQYAYSSALAQDGGYALTGTSNDSSGKSTIYFLKTDSAGNLLQSKTLSYADPLIGNVINSTADHGFMIIGRISDSLNASFPLLIKTDSAGTVQWIKRYDANSTLLLLSGEQTSGGGYIMAGNATIPGLGLVNVLMKTDAAGNFMWAQTLPLLCSNFKVVECNDHGFIYSGCKVTGSNYDIHIIKTDSTGVLQWSKTYGGPGGQSTIDLKRTHDGCYAILGINSSGSSSVGSMIIKIDSVGNILWSNTYSGPGTSIAHRTLQCTHDNGFVFCLLKNSSTMPGNIVRTDSMGNLQWAKHYSDTLANDIADVHETGDYNFIAAGNTFNNGLYDVCLFKPDATGNTSCYQQNINYTTTPSNLQVAAIATTLIPVVINDSNITLSAANNIAAVTNLCSSTGLITIPGENMFSAFPNPVTDNFTITGTVTGYLTIELYDITGRKITTLYNGSYHAHEIITSRLQNLSKGLYLIKCFTANGNVNMILNKQ